jgi:hypothetical protein
MLRERAVLPIPELVRLHEVWLQHADQVRELHQIQKPLTPEEKRARQKQQQRQWRERNKERVKEERRARYLANKPDRPRKPGSGRKPKYPKEIAQACYRENARLKRLANPQKYRQKALEKYRRNKPRYFANANKRRASKLRATPTWADKELIEHAYFIAQHLSQRTGVIHHVDHFVPLKNSRVCGLHVHENLQIIPATKNLQKHNSFEPH